MEGLATHIKYVVGVYFPTLSVVWVGKGKAPPTHCSHGGFDVVKGVRHVIVRADLVVAR